MRGRVESHHPHRGPAVLHQGLLGLHYCCAKYLARVSGLLGPALGPYLAVATGGACACNPCKPRTAGPFCVASLSPKLRWLQDLTSVTDDRQIERGEPMGPWRLSLARTYCTNPPRHLSPTAVAPCQGSVCMAHFCTPFPPRTHSQTWDQKKQERDGERERHTHLHLHTHRQALLLPGSSLTLSAMLVNRSF